MQIREIVIDASPLITLFRSGQSEILPQLFENIWVPDAVWLEITQGGHRDLAAQQLPSMKWAKRVHVGIISELIQRRDLGKGESEVLTFA
jgi:predicted nucleic acid-binding protein